jgi:hypothetical protein
MIRIRENSKLRKFKEINSAALFLVAPYNKCAVRTDYMGVETTIFAERQPKYRGKHNE